MSNDLHAREDWADLMRRSQDGDQRAYATVLRALIPAVRAYARRQVFDDVLVEDVVQDVLLTVHRLLHTYDSDRPLLPWVVAITSARAIDALRKQGRRREREAGHDDQGAEPGRDGGMLTPDEMVARQDVKRLLNILPARQRMVVEMVKLQEMSLNDAAEASRLTIPAIKSLLHRAFIRLKDYGTHHHG